MENEYKKSKQTEPLDKKEKVQKSNDEHIDQDFEGYPHSPAAENVIKPESYEDSISAGLRDGENSAQTPEKIKKSGLLKDDKQEEEINSDGSANAFERTEGIPAGKFDKIDEKNKDY